MTIIDSLSITPEAAGMLLLSALVGALLGMIYFGGLWFTIQRLERVRQPAFLFTGSFALRMVIVLAGFFLIADGRFERLLASLVGFFITRQIMLKWAQTPQETGRGSSPG